MLMDDDLHLGRVGLPKKIHHLLDVQVIGRRDGVTSGFGKQVNRLVVGNVQGEVADQPGMLRPGFSIRWRR